MQRLFRRARAAACVVAVAVAWMLSPARAAEPGADARLPVLRSTVLATAGPLVRSAPAEPAQLGSSFELTFGSGLSGQPLAQAAFARAAARWGALLGDGVTVRLSVDYQPLATNVLGQSTSYIAYGGYAEVRDLVAAGGEPGDAAEVALLAALPSTAQFSAWLPTGFSMDGNAYITTANWKALGGEYADSDGSITFSSSVGWDFDPSDGIAPGLFDFEGAAMHEMGHNLGFISEIDYVDSVLGEGETASDVWPAGLDLFRFRAADVTGPGFNFTTSPRDLVPGGSQVFYYGDGYVAMSTGVERGDGRQGSHWKDGLGLGILDPTAAPGELLAISQNDLRALDLIGWDVAPEPTTLALLAAAILTLRRRARRAHK